LKINILLISCGKLKIFRIVFIVFSKGYLHFGGSLFDLTAKQNGIVRIIATNSRISRKPLNSLVKKI